jgi:hypothetical protein
MGENRQVMHGGDWAASKYEIAARGKLAVGSMDVQGQGTRGCWRGGKRTGGRASRWPWRSPQSGIPAAMEVAHRVESRMRRTILIPT